MQEMAPAAESIPDMTESRPESNIGPDHKENFDKSVTIEETCMQNQAGESKAGSGEKGDVMKQIQGEQAPNGPPAPQAEGCSGSVHEAYAPEQGCGCSEHAGAPTEVSMQGGPQGFSGPVPGQGPAGPFYGYESRPPSNGPEAMYAYQGHPGAAAYQSAPQFNPGFAVPGQSHPQHGPQAYPGGPYYAPPRGPAQDWRGPANGGPQGCDHHAPQGEWSQGPGHPKHDAHQYGQLMRLVNDMASGNADAARVMDFLGGLDAQFWKGALMGVGATLLLTNDAAKNAIVKGLSGLAGIFGKDGPEEKKES